MNTKKLLLGVALIAGLLQSASAVNIPSPITYSTKYLVGTYDASISGVLNGGVSTEVAIAQEILNLSFNTTGQSSQWSSGGDDLVSNSAFDYSAVLDSNVSNANKNDTPGEYSGISGYDYVMGKYDGTNAGYILYFLDGEDNSAIPQYSFSIWSNVNQSDQSYEISHWTGFNAISTDPIPDPVPDSGATVALMGIALAGLGFLKRCNG